MEPDSQLRTQRIQCFLRHQKLFQVHKLYSFQVMLPLKYWRLFLRDTKCNVAFLLYRHIFHVDNQSSFSAMLLLQNPGLCLVDTLYRQLRLYWLNTLRTHNPGIF